jgi:hypothetical protein
MIENIEDIAGPMLGALAAVVLDGNTMIPMGAAAGVIWAVYRLTRRVTIWDSSLRSHSAQLDEIRSLLMTRPCFTVKGCNTPTEIKREIKSDTEETEL